MDLHEERKSQIEQRLGKVVRLLGECELSLIDETDPKTRSKLKTQISELKEEMSNCQLDLDTLEETNTQRNSALMMAKITYDDINFVITALLNQRAMPTNNQDNYQLTYPEEKMSKNDLTHEIRFVLGMGLAKAGEVRHFIENIAKISFPDLAERLKASLKAEYINLMAAGIRGDELFNRLYIFSHQNSSSASRQSAGLAVLCYFFETCDVFEP